MLELLTAEELARWRILDANYAFGERRMDRRFAKLAAHVMASIPWGPKGPFRLQDLSLEETIYPPRWSDDSRAEDAGPTAADFDAAFGKS